MKYELPKLPYAYDALEPYIDTKTMEIHHDKHHQGYTDKMNAILEKYPNLEAQSPEEIMKDLANSGMNEQDQLAFRNNGGGYINHSLYWQSMSPKKAIDNALIKEIEAQFGSIDEFKQQFSDFATKQFGSGWAWLVKSNSGELKIYSTANQDSPLLTGDTPFFCIDVWEHAYYLKYQNKRAEYIQNWWNVLKFI